MLYLRPPWTPPLHPLLFLPRSQEADAIRLKRDAKKQGGFYVPGEAKLAFVVRIRGINAVDPKTRKILQLLRLRQINNGVFVKINKVRHAPLTDRYDYRILVRAFRNSL